MTVELRSVSPTNPWALWNQMTYTAFICKAIADILEKNDVASEQSNKSRAITIKKKTLSFSDSKLQGQFSSALTTVANIGKTVAQKQTMTFQDDGIRYILKLTPWISASIDVLPQQTPIIITIKPLHQVHSVDAWDLQNIFGFSPRQAETARLLALGLTAAEIASELNVAESTIRSHIKSILDKTGARNQQRAIALLHSTRVHIN
ncbi:MAG: helix-turn-helix transcriptional regulator [Pseudomonadales bacterium]|nr:helix-turn-helix transcriptional regulator [Pseudomonadales bacterium]